MLVHEMTEPSVHTDSIPFCFFSLSLLSTYCQIILSSVMTKRCSYFVLFSQPAFSFRLLLCYKSRRKGAVGLGRFHLLFSTCLFHCMEVAIRVLHALHMCICISICIVIFIFIGTYSICIFSIICNTTYRVRSVFR